jgi:hypothetical protein
MPASPKPLIIMAAPSWIGTTASCRDAFTLSSMLIPEKTFGQKKTQMRLALGFSSI